MDDLPAFLDVRLTRSPERLASMARKVARYRNQAADPERGRQIKMPTRRSIAAAKALGVAVGFLRSAGAESSPSTEATMKAKKKAASARRKGPTGKVLKSGKTPARPKARTTGGENKTVQLEALLANPTTLDAVCKKFGWLAHSARAAISTLPGKIAKARPGVKAEMLKAKNDKGATTYQLALKGSAKAAA